MEGFSQKIEFAQKHRKHKFAVSIVLDSTKKRSLRKVKYSALSGFLTVTIPECNSLHPNRISFTS